MFQELKKSSPSEMGPYLSSKWINHYFLIDESELKELLMLFNTKYIFSIGKMYTSYQDGIIENLLNEYQRVIENLQKSTIDLTLIKAILPLAISSTKDAFYVYRPKEDIFTIKITKPVLQLQLSYFRYSKLSSSISLNSLGDDSIFWGFKLAYPQIFQDPKSHKIYKVDSSFANFKYFALIRKWLRDKTSSVKLIFDQKRINTSLRIGKKCLSWINLHPKLTEIGCKVDNTY